MGHIYGAGGDTCGQWLTNKEDDYFHDTPNFKMCDFTIKMIFFKYSMCVEKIQQFFSIKTS